MRMLAGMSRSPNARNKPLRSRRVLRVLVAELVEHHLLLRTDAEREQDAECDQVRRTCHPIGNHERLTDRVEQQRHVHRMADFAIDAIGDQSMLFSHLEGNRPVRTQISVGPVEKPKTNREASDPGNEGAGPKWILRERERWRRDPNQRNEEPEPGKSQEDRFHRPFAARDDLDTSTSVTVRGANGNHHRAGNQNRRLRSPGIHGRALVLEIIGRSPVLGR